MWDSSRKAAVSGVGFSKVYRHTDVPLGKLAVDAVREAVASSGLQMSDIEGLCIYPEFPAAGSGNATGRGYRTSLSTACITCSARRFRTSGGTSRTRQE